MKTKFYILFLLTIVSIHFPVLSQVQFSKPTDLTNFIDRPESVYAVDLDGDGDADVLSSSQEENKIVWFENRLNQVSQDFGPQQNIAALILNPKSIYVTDLDDDGDADILSASSGDHKIAWYENRLNQREQDFGAQRVILDQAIKPTSVFAVDLDGDGDADVLSSMDSRIVWFENRLNQPESDFGTQQIISNAENVQSVFSVDLDGDGDADVISSSSGVKKIEWYENRLNQTQGDFSPSQFISSDSNMLAIDLDNDNDVDIISLSEFNISWYENQLNQTEQVFSSQKIIISSGSGTSSIYAVDFDADGDADILTAFFFDNKIAWYENRLNQTEQDFGPQKIITTTANAVGAVLGADLNGDGDADVLSVFSNDDKIAWYENRINQTEQDFGSQKIIATAANGASSVYAADLDGDGRKDVLSASQSDHKVAWYKNRLDQPQQDYGSQQIITNTIEGAISVFSIDLDGDSDSDVVSAFSEGDQIAWFENRLNQLEQDFGSPQIISSLVDRVRSIFSVDLDGDGDADVLSASANDDKIAWYENRLNQLEKDFGPQRIISTAVDGAWSVFAIDLDDDSDADILSASQLDRKIAWYENRLNQPEQDFGPQQIISTLGAWPRSVFAVDLDSDGDSDVLSAYFGNISWYENKLNELEQNFGQQQIITRSVSDARSVFAVDLDGDGDADVLSASWSYEIGTIAWYENRLNQNEHNFGPRQLIMATSEARAVFASDLDNDGDNDIIIAHKNSVSVIYNLYNIFGSVKWYFADGDTRDETQTYLLLLNPNESGVKATYTHYFESQEPVSFETTFTPLSRTTIRMHNDLPEIDGLNPAGFASVIESDLPIFAERAMYWPQASLRDGIVTDTFRTRATAAIGASELRESWFLAEGTTTLSGEGQPRDTLIYIGNPHEQNVDVELEFLREGETPVLHAIMIPAQRRATVTASSIAGLESANFSTWVRSKSGLGIFADRTMTGAADNLADQWSHATAAIPAISANWYFGGGTLLDGFETFVTLANPTTETATVNLRFLRETEEPFLTQIELLAMRRQTVITSTFHELVGRRFSIEVQSTGPAIAAERSIFWRANGFTNRSGASNTAGNPILRPAFFMPEGAVFGRSNFRCEFAIGNPNDETANITVNFMTEESQIVETQLTLEANRSRTIVANDFLNNVFPDDRTISFSTLIQSTNNRPIITDRLMYVTTTEQEGSIENFSGHASNSLPISEANANNMLQRFRKKQRSTTE